MAARSVLASGSTTSLTASFADSGALPAPASTALGTDYGLVAWYEHAATDQPATPTGWTLIGGGASGTISVWAFAKRGNSTANGITVVGATAVAAKIQLNAYSGVYADAFWVPTTANGAGVGNAATVTSSTVTSTEPAMTAVAAIFASSTNGSATGFAWSNSFVVKAGSSSSSSYSWAEKVISATATAVSTVVSWTTNRDAWVLVVLLRVTAPASTGPTFKWRTSDGVLHNATMKWRDASHVLHDVNLGSSAPTSPFRFAKDQPFKIGQFSNLSLGNTATFEANSGRTAKLLTGTPTINGLIDASTSAPRWSYPYFVASATDPIRSVINASTGAVIASFRIPDAAAPTGGTDMPVGIILPSAAASDPGGWDAREIYKFTRLSNGDVSTTYYNQNDLRLDGLQHGSRASGISFFIGTIRKFEMLARNIPHTLAMACPASLLNNAPTSADGTVVTSSQGGSVWPARLLDNQTNNPYANATNAVAMGSMWAIPPSVDITTLGLTADGLALATALQDYGTHILVQSSLVALYVEPTTDATTNAAYSNMKQDWINILFHQLRRVTNNTPGTLVSNSPTSNATVAGGDSAGRRRDPALPLFEDQPYP